MDRLRSEVARIDQALSNPDLFRKAPAKVADLGGERARAGGPGRRGSRMAGGGGILRSGEAEAGPRKGRTYRDLAQ